eukprot:jgi/Hompol1/2168/HPOL_005875-RA
MAQVRVGDYGAFLAELDADNRTGAWLKFSDLCLDETQRSFLTHSDLERLLKLLANQSPPKFLAMRSVFRNARQLGLSPSIGMYNILVRAHGRVADLDRVNSTIVEMRSDGIEPTISTYNQVLSVAADSLDMSGIIKLLDQIKSEGMQPDTETYDVMIAAAVSRDDMLLAKQYIAEMEAAGLAMSTRTYAQLFKMYFKQKNIDEVDRLLTLFIAQPNSAVRSDASLCASIIKGFCDLDLIQRADDILSWMVENDIQPGHGDLYVLVKAKAMKDDVEGALRILRMIESQNDRPDMTLYHAVVDGCSRTGNIEQAISLRDTLKKRGIKPSINIQRSILSGLIDADRGNEACAMYDELLSEKYDITLPVYNLLFKAASLEQDLDMYRKEFESLIFELTRAGQGQHARTRASANKSKTADHDGAGSDQDDTHADTEKSADIAVHQIVGASEISKRNMLVIELYKEMASANVIPSEEALCEVMSVHRRLKDLIGVVKVWSTLQKTYPRPSAASVAVLIQSASELGQKRTADAIKRMIEKDKLEMNLDAYEAFAILGARCGMSQLVIHTMVDMVSAGFPLTASLYRRIKLAFHNAVPPNKEAARAFAEFVEEQFPEIVTQDETIGESLKKDLLA